MVDSMLELLPNASIHHIGMYHVSGTNPVQYYNRLPRKCEADVAYVLDPMIATAGTVMSVVAILKKVSSQIYHFVRTKFALLVSAKRLHSHTMFIESCNSYSYNSNHLH